LAPAFVEQSANRLGRVEIELTFTLMKVVIVLNLHEQRYEASMREEFDLVTAARCHAGLLFVSKMTRTSKMEA
jgi:hypothetical protein